MSGSREELGMKIPKVIAVDTFGDIEYEFRVGPGNMPEAPQLTHMVQLRRKGSGNDWESAMTGSGISRGAALIKFAENYYRIGDIRKLVPIDDKLKEYVSEEISKLKVKENEKEKGREQELIEKQDEKIRMETLRCNEELIAKEMKSVKAKKAFIEITTVDGVVKINSFLIRDIFAYHKDLNKDCYSITHVPTGLRVISNLNRYEARELTYRLSLLRINNADNSARIIIRRVIEEFTNRDPIKIKNKLKLIKWK